MLVAIDASVIVHAVTGKPVLRTAARNWLNAVELSRSLLVTSALSHLECFVRPNRLASKTERRLYETFFQGLIPVPIEDDVLDLASRIRAHHRSFRTPDAIHLACAQLAQADLFVTADRRLKAYKEIAVAYSLKDLPADFIR